MNGIDPRLLKTELAVVRHGSMWHDLAQPLTRIADLPMADSPQREVLAVTRPRSLHPVSTTSPTSPAG